MGFGASEVAELTSWRDAALEPAILDEISLDLPWSVIERFSKIVRLSGTPGERAAFEIITGHLDRLGISYTLHEPECFISLPLKGTIRTVGGRAFGAKTSAMSVSTEGAEIEGELVYIASASGTGAGSVVSASVDLGEIDVAGKIVITEGMPFPGKVTAVTAAGALAGVFVSPGLRIHESICTNIWGTPDLDSVKRIPAIPVVAVNNPDGQELIELAKRGARVALSTTLDTRWRPIPVLVAEIPGSVAPDEFVLLHGHLDSWHEGVGDNATGDATMLELARIFSHHRDKLVRSLKIAWWSGHSHGRYAGSTWFADTFGIELARNCVAQVDCDSPGCRWAETFNDLTCMSEAEPLVHAAIRQIAGITPETTRPPRAGDYSFNGIGITSFYMLSSTMSDDLRAKKDYYAVGGCGANIAWHTEDDAIEIADRENLLRDMRVYAGSVLRVLNAPAHPFDWRRTTAEFRETLGGLQSATGDDFDFAPSREANEALQASLDRFYASAPVGDPGGSETRRFNRVQRRLGRLLIPVNYSRMAPFWHDPALDVSPLPDLAPATSITSASGDVAKRGILRAHLTRGQNRLVWTLMQAREVVEGAIN